MSKHYFKGRGKLFISRNNEHYETFNFLDLVLVKGNRNIIDINHSVKKLIITGYRNIVTINARKIQKISLEGNNNKIFISYSCKIYDISDYGKRNKIYKRTNDDENENDELQNSNSEDAEEVEEVEEEKEETNDNTQTNVEINNNSTENEEERDEDEQNNGNIIIGGFGVISNAPLDNNDNEIIRNFILSRIARNLPNNNKNISEINNILDDLIDIPFKSSNKKTKEGNEKCVICYENFKEKEIVKMTSCFHIYHFKCIKKWIENKIELRENPDCPICRRKL